MNVLSLILKALVSLLIIISVQNCKLPVDDTILPFWWLSQVKEDVQQITEDGFSYGNITVSLAVNVSIPSIQPTLNGKPISVSISPSLPIGLNLDPITGIVSGTPSIISSLTTYTATANFSGKIISASFQLEVLSPPTSLNYAGSPYTFMQGTAITNSIPTASGTVQVYSISPALPSGLLMNSATGEISGTPTISSSAQTYTITASNVAGSITTIITIAVLGPPNGLSYSSNNYTFTQNASIGTLIPSVSGSVVSYSILPALPTGLTFNTTTGEISGTSTIDSSTTSYTVTASNLYGSTTYTFNLTVNLSIVSVSGTILGLSNAATATGVQIIDNLGNTLTLPKGSVSFSFPSIPQGSAYNVQVITQPTSPWQTCTVTNGAGTIGSTNVTNVSINCTDNTYTISGTITGLSGTGLVLIDGATTQSVSGAGFTFSTAKPSMSTYSVAINTNPTSPWQTCTVTNGAGTITNANITDVQINCTTNTYIIFGNITGYTLATTGKLAISNGTNTLSNISNTTTSYSLTALPSGTGYTMSITNPTGPGFTCTPSVASGTINNASISVDISCVQTEFIISGTVTGLATGNTIELTYSSGNTQTYTGPVTGHSKSVPAGAYGVYISVQPSNQYCSIVSPTAPSGTLASNLTLDVNCVDGYFSSGRIQPNPIVPINVHLYQGEVSTIAGSGTAGVTDGAGAAASFNNAQDIVHNGSVFYISDSDNSKIRKMDSNGNVGTIVGSGSYGSVDSANGLTAQFKKPKGIATNGTYLYVADFEDHKIRRISLLGTNEVTTIAGTGLIGSADGVSTAASFNYPHGLALDGQYLYVADRHNHSIRKIDLVTNTVSTLSSGGVIATSEPVDLVVVDGYLYVNCAVSKIVKIDKLSGSQTLLAGGTIGYADGFGTSAKFNFPAGITTDSKYLYVTDFNGQRIRKIRISDGLVNTIAGNGTSGLTDNVGIKSNFSSPRGITTDGKHLYFVNNHSIRKISNYGLVAYYPLKGTVNDYSGVNDGTLLDAVSNVGRYNEPSGAYSFSNSGQKIQSSFINLSTNSITISAWIKSNGGAVGNQLIAYSGSTSANGYGFYANSSNQLKFVQGGFGPTDCSYTIPLNQWIHITAVSREDGKWAIYVNGKNVSNFSLSTPNPPSSNRFMIGSNTENSDFWNGSITDVRMYNRPLHESEINELAQDADSSLVGSSYSTGATGLLHHYSFQNGTLSDHGPIGMSLTNVGATATTGKNGVTNSAYYVDGTSYLSATPVELSGKASRTVCAWIFPESLPAASTLQTIVSYGNSMAANQSFGITFYKSGALYYIVIPTWGTDFLFATNIFLNTWSHVCATYNGTNVSAFLNGKQLGTTPAPLIDTGLNSFRIGSWLDGSSKIRGRIDDVRLYNIALNSSAIRQLANQIPAGLVARFDFIGDTNDVSGFGNHLTNTGATPTTDKNGNVNQAYQFNGTTSSMSNTSTTLPFPTGSSERSLCYWAKADQALTGVRVVLTYGASNATNANWIGANVLNTSSPTILGGVYGSPHSPSGFLPLQTWNHVCMVLTGGTAQMYMNGVAIGTTVSTATWTTTADNLTVGKMGVQYYYPGAIDEVSVYARALNLNEVKTLSGYHPMQVSSWSPTIASSSLTLHLRADTYNLSDATNLTVASTWSDTSGKDFHLTPVNPPVYNSGTNGINNRPTITFDGIDDYFDYGGAGSITYINGASLFAVARSNSVGADAGHKTIFSKENTNPLTTSCRMNLLRTTLTTDFHFAVENSTPINANAILAEDVILSSTNSGGNQFIQKSGGTLNSNAGATLNCVSPSTDPLRIGLRGISAGDSYYKGKISEIILFNRSLSGAEIYLINCYLSSKYRIELGHSCN